MPADTGKTRENKYVTEAPSTYPVKNKDKEAIVIHNSMSKELLQCSRREEKTSKAYKDVAGQRLRLSVDDLFN